MKRGYYVYPVDEFWGLAVVASSTKEAKRIAFRSGELSGIAWLDIRCVWQRGADTKNIEIGIVSNFRLALLRGFFGFIEDFACDICGDITLLRAYKNKALCEECIFKEQEGNT